MMHKMRRLRQMNNTELWLLFQTSMVFLLVVPALRFLGLKRTSRILGLTPSPPTSYGQEQLLQAKDISHFVNRIADHLPFHSTCLVRSLVLRRILISNNINSELHIGVQKAGADQPDFQAHAWVEMNGVPLNDTEDVKDRYQHIYAEQFGQGY